MGIAERTMRKLEAAAQPYLEEGETIKAATLTSTAKPPPVSGRPVLPQKIRIRTVVATDRNLYVFKNRLFTRTKLTGVEHKQPLTSAGVDVGDDSEGGRWIRIGGGPKLWSHATLGFGQKSFDDVLRALGKLEETGDR